MCMSNANQEFKVSLKDKILEDFLEMECDKRNPLGLLCK